MKTPEAVNDSVVLLNRAGAALPQAPKNISPTGLPALPEGDSKRAAWRAAGTLPVTLDGSQPQLRGDSCNSGEIDAEGGLSGQKYSGLEIHCTFGGVNSRCQPLTFSRYLATADA